MRRPSPALAIALVALVVALGGTGYAAVALPAGSIGTTQLRRGAVTAAKVRPHTLTRRLFAAGALPRVIKGPSGPPGAPAGPLHVFTVVAQAPTAQGAFGSGTEHAFSSAVCPPGSRPVGGGWLTSGSDDRVTSAFDSADVSGAQNGYNVNAVNHGAGVASIQAQAICLAGAGGP